MPAIARHKLEFMMDGPHANQEVEITDEVALAAQPATHPTKAVHDRFRQRQDGFARQELLEAGLGLGWILGIDGALHQLPVGEDADRQAVRGDLAQRLQRWLLSTQHVNV